jgi:hypothetical protein
MDTPTPVPPENFERVPVILSRMDDYENDQNLPAADLNPPAGVIAGAHQKTEALPS